jgi:hypothetical protein
MKKQPKKPKSPLAPLSTIDLVQVAGGQAPVEEKKK